MKRVFEFLLGYAIISLAICSCSNEQSGIRDINPRMDNESSADDNEIINPYETLDVSSYVSEHSTLFGSNVQVFDSLGEADTLLYEWNSLSYDELRMQYSLRGYYNEDIECKVELDSIYKEVLLNNGYSPDDELDDEVERQLDSLYYLAVMQHDPTLLYTYSIEIDDIESEYYGETFNIIEPKTELDLTAFMNDKRLCIIEANVVKLLLDSTIIISPLLNYHYISGYESLEQLEMLEANNASSLLDTTAIIWQPLYESNMQRNINSIDKYQINYVNGNYYKMTIKYNIARLYNLFHLVENGDYNFSAHLTIKNYKKGCFNSFWLSRLNTYGIAETLTYVETYHDNPNIKHTFNINSRFATYIRYKSRFVTVYYFRPDYSIIGVHFDIDNGRNHFVVGSSYDVRH